MDIEFDELLSLLSDRVKNEMAQEEIERQRQSEIGWLFKQQEYLLAAVREFFAEFSQRIDGIEERMLASDSNQLFEKISLRIDAIEKLILSSDQRHRSLQKQLAIEIVNLSRLQEEQARQGSTVDNRLLNDLEETRKRIEAIKDQMEVDNDDSG